MIETNKLIEERFKDGTIRYGYYYDGMAVFRPHREDGPAVIHPNGTQSWYINGKNVTFHVEEWLTERNIYYTDMTDEDKLALSFFIRSLTIQI